MKRRRSQAQKEHLYRVKFQADLWRAVCVGQGGLEKGWDTRDKNLRRALRIRFWEQIGLVEKGDAMPKTDVEFTAIKTFCLHLADPDNITRSIAWDNCRADYRKFNEACIADAHQRRAGVAEYQGRSTAAGQPLDDPLTKKQTQHRLYRMRESARKAERTKPAPHNQPAN